MSVLILESYDEARGGWVVAEELRPGDRPGSLSDNAPLGRRVYVFGLDADDEGGGRTATIGVAPFGDQAALLDPRRGSILVRLGPGTGQEVFEAVIVGDVGGKRQRVRFRLQGDGDG